VVEVSDGGAISGMVSFSGKVPKPRKKSVDKDTEVCGGGTRTYNEVNVGSGGGLAKAVVFITKIKSGKAWPAEMNNGFEVVQEKCRFVPKSFVVRRGDKLHVKNRDGVTHNVHAYEAKGKTRITMFNSGQKAGAEFDKKIKMRRRGSHGLKLECDLHPFMHQWLFVADNPYYVVTGDDGEFSINDIPPGKYSIMAWHPVLGEKKQKVKLATDTTTKLAFEFSR